MENKALRFLLVLLLVLLTADVALRLTDRPVHAAFVGPQYKVVGNPGRDAPLLKYEQILNDMSKQGWQFEGWLYRGSAQNPDLIFKK
jgi:hypothetical protein